MSRLLTLLGVAALGAGAMYYLDPDNGRRRRALVADRACSVTNDLRDYMDKQTKRGADQMQGMMARFRSRLSAPPPSDQQLLGQVRAHLGRVVSYPRAVETDVQQGRVMLRGDVLADEFNLLMAELWSLPGVAAVDSTVSLHTEPTQVSAFAGKPHRITKARMRRLGRGLASSVAVAGGIGSVARALRMEGMASRLGMFSLAGLLLAFGAGGNLRRFMVNGASPHASPSKPAQGGLATASSVTMAYPSVGPTPDEPPETVPSPSLH